MKTAAQPLWRLAAIVLTTALLLTAGIGIAFGAGVDAGYTDFRTETSAATKVLPGATAAVLAECEPGERAVGGDFQVGGDHDGVEVVTSRRVVVAPRVSGWVVAVVNRTDEDQFAAARAVCERV